MNITEANHTVRLLRFAAGQHAGTADQVRDSFAFLADRAGKPLQMQIQIDPYAVDAAIQARQP